ncbi:MAG: tRNA pseudouridine(55) synthase TruB [Defluviitaleaceae bacterium]|nr:tRNA pseudouridine(55) synthase TruB [Defluviitaleaceae bacterium]
MYDGVLNIFKPAGMTSSDVVQKVKRITKSKAGHTGTLDPDATGVLPVCLGKATKISDYIMNGDKEYIATVSLGASTDTGDASGVIIARGELVYDKAPIEAVLPGFVGEISQIPPMYSALKVKGKKLYEYAREGITVEREARKITIFELEALRWDLPQSFALRVRCSKGTYIRTLCEDIGASLGTVAHMGSLVRTGTSGFDQSDSIRLEELTAENVQQHLMSMENALGNMPKIAVAEEGEKLLLNGNKVPVEYVADSWAADTRPYRVYSHTGELVGIFRVEGEFLRPVTMLL